MKIAIFTMNAPSVEPLAEAAVATVLAAGHRCVRVCYWLSDHAPVAAITSETVPLLTLCDGGLPGAPRLTADQYAAAGGAISDFADLCLHDVAVHGWPLTSEWLNLESAYYQRMRGIAIKARNLLRATAPDAIIVNHGAEPVSRAIATESAGLGIPVMLLESPFFPGHINLDIGGQHFFSNVSRLARTLPHRMAAPLTPSEAAQVETFKASWSATRTSKYPQNTSQPEWAKLEAFLKAADGPIVFLPAQLSTDANVITALGPHRTLSELYLRVMSALTPSYRVILKTHPMDNSNETAQFAALDNVLVVNDVDIHDIIPRVNAVAVVSSNVGLEALLLGKPVVVLGRPFYSGFGLTKDVKQIDHICDAISASKPPPLEALDRLISAIVFEHLLPVGEPTRFNARLDEAHAAGRQTWRLLDRLVDQYADVGSARIRLISRYNTLAQTNLSHLEIREAMPDVEWTLPQSPITTPQTLGVSEENVGQIKRPHDFPDADPAILTAYAYAATVIRPGARILDIHCGPGFGSILLAENAAHIDAVDPNPHNIAFAKQTWRHDRVHHHAASSGRWLGQGETTYDAVVTFGTLEHLNDPARFLTSVWARVRPGGVLLATARNEESRPLESSLDGLRLMSAQSLRRILDQLPQVSDSLIARQDHMVIGSRRASADRHFILAVKNGSAPWSVHPPGHILPYERQHMPRRNTIWIAAAEFSTNVARRSADGIHIALGTTEGHVVYGPYRTLPAGEYTVTFDVICESEICNLTNGTLTLEAVNVRGEELARAVARNDALRHNRLEVAFSNTDPSAPLEFRIHAKGPLSGNLKFRGITIRRAEFRFLNASKAPLP